MTEPLTQWLERQYRYSARRLLENIEARHVVKTRAGLGQTVTVDKGAIVASPVLGAYDPDPDYFFHWFRDSAIVVDALRLLYEGGDAAALDRFDAFVRFSSRLFALDGRQLVSVPEWRAHVAPDFARFVRPDAELALVHGEAVAAETRVNPDGTLDVLDWPRPQHDGPALRALTVLRWLASAPIGGELAEAAAELLRADLAFVRNRWSVPCFDIWEEERGLHYYTLAVSAGALTEGARWLDAQGAREEAAFSRRESERMWRALDAYWLEDEGYYRSRVLESGERSTKELDISVVVAAIHAGRRDGTHSPRDPRILATLDRLEALFDARYAINRNRPAERGVAMGRYADDVYYSGGAYYFSTLAAAELCFRAAAGAPRGADLVKRGDAFLETVRAFTPPTGDLAEQFCQRTGAQTSAKHLTWSYAAFISAIAARRRVSA